MPKLTLRVGLKTDPVEYRFSYEWLFRLLAEEGIEHAQLGSFFELYQLPDEFFLELRRQAAAYGVRISSVFTTHRELGGCFRREPGWEAVMLHSYRRMIEVGALLGSSSVGGNPGSVLRDQPEMKAVGMERYLAAMKQLMAYAHMVGLPYVTIEPMSCLAEPPTLPEEIVALGEELSRYHARHPEHTSGVGYCVDVAHGYRDQEGALVWDNVVLFRATLPYLNHVHLKNTDTRFDATFGFTEAERQRGIVQVETFRDLLLANADLLPEKEVVGYLEIGGPKLGRDYSDHKLEGMLRESLRYLRETFETN
jgi:sugar phosphate isomerase/epimerase